MTPWKRGGQVAAITVAMVAVALAIAGSAPVAGLAVGDSWVYRYHELSGGVEWIGNWTETYLGALPGGLLGFRVSGDGVLVGTVSGTWTLEDVNAYRPTDGAFVNSTSVLELQYVEFGTSYHVIDTAQTSNNPPMDLGGPLQVGAVTSGTTTQIVTRTVTVNGNSTGPVTTSTDLTVTRTIIGQFQVSVPAGTFTAWQIRYVSSDTAPGYVEYAYSETVGNSVRIQVFDVAENVVASLELQGFSPSDGTQGPTAPLTTGVLPYAAVGATAAVVAAIVWRDRRRRPGSLPGPGAPGEPPPPPRQP